MQQRILSRHVIERVRFRHHSADIASDSIRVKFGNQPKRPAACELGALLNIISAQRTLDMVHEQHQNLEPGAEDEWEGQLYARLHGRCTGDHAVAPACNRDSYSMQFRLSV